MTGNIFCARKLAASILGKSDPKSGQIAAYLNRQSHLKSRHSRTYAVGCKWHANWLFDGYDRGESVRLVVVGNSAAGQLVVLDTRLKQTEKTL